MSAGPRNGRIDLIRGVSILLVLFHHFNIAYPLSDTTLSRLLGWRFVHALARNGNYGVTMFFVVSGFLITSNTQRRWGLAGVRLRAFWGLRAARILPCLLLLLVVVNLLASCGLAIFASHPDPGDAVPPWLVDLAALTFWMNVLMAHAGWLDYVLCVLWSLSVEEVFYLSFPLLCLLCGRAGRLAWVLLMFVVAGPLWRLAHQGDEDGFLYGYLANFDCIAIGCCAALLPARRLPAPARSVPAQVVVAAAMAFLYLVGSIGETGVYGITLMALGTALLLVTAVDGPADMRAGHPSLAALRGCGRLSYELYLFHLVVLGMLRTVWPPASAHGDRPLLLLLAYLALSIVLAAAIARMYSEPLNRRLRARLARPGRAIPA